MIRIGLIDDNPVLLRNLRQNLSIFDEVEVVFTAHSGQDAVSKASQEEADVLLMDIEMPEMDGIEATAKLKARLPLLKIMMLTVMDREDKIFEAIKAGASGYLMKDEKPSRIIAAVEELMDGGAPMSPQIALKTLQILRSQEMKPVRAIKSPADFKLTNREIEILEKIAQGLTYQQMADELFISAKTARKHIENIYQKLHVHSKLEAVKLAQKNRWI